MKHATDIIWKGTLAFIAFGIAAQVAWALIKPIEGFVVTGIVIVVVLTIYLRLRKYYLGGGHSGNDKIIRGR